MPIRAAVWSGQVLATMPTHVAMVESRALCTGLARGQTQLLAANAPLGSRRLADGDPPAVHQAGRIYERARQDGRRRHHLFRNFIGSERVFPITASTRGAPRFSEPPEMGGHSGIAPVYRPQESKPKGGIGSKLPWLTFLPVFSNPSASSAFLSLAEALPKLKKP